MKFESDRMLKMYMKDIEKYPLITPTQEIALSTTIRDSQDPIIKQKAINELVEGNLKIAVKVAMKYRHLVESFNLPNLTIMDLIQAGNIGIINSAENFDGRKGAKFITYAYQAVTRKIQDLIKDSRLVKIPNNHHKYIWKIQELETKHKGPVSDETIMAELNITASMLRMIKEDRCVRVDLNDEEETPMDSIISIPSDVLDNLGKKDLDDYLREKISQLKPKYQEIVLYRFFSDEGATLEQTAEKLGVSKQRIKQVLNVALPMLRKLIEEDRMFSKLGIIREKKDEYTEKQCRKRSKKVKIDVERESEELDTHKEIKDVHAN